jgi:hypothetical protein
VLLSRHSEPPARERQHDHQVVLVLTSRAKHDAPGPFLNDSSPFADCPEVSATSSSPKNEAGLPVFAGELPGMRVEESYLRGLGEESLAVTIRTNTADLDTARMMMPSGFMCAIIRHDKSEDQPPLVGSSWRLSRAAVPIARFRNLSSLEC